MSSLICCYMHLNTMILHIFIQYVIRTQYALFDGFSFKQPPLGQVRVLSNQYADMNKNMLQTPKIIHQIIGPNVTPLINRCIESWKKLITHGFEIRTWDDEKIAKFISTTHPFAYESFIDARNHAEAADIARYLIVHSFGGYYVDWDVELLDFNGFLTLDQQYPNGYLLVDPLNNTLASEYFCSAPNDEYLMNLTKDITGIYKRGLRDFISTPKYSGPYRMRDSLVKHPQTMMTKVPVKQVFAYDYSEIRNPPVNDITAPLIHYWVHSWIT